MKAFSYVIVLCVNLWEGNKHDLEFEELFPT